MQPGILRHLGSNLGALRNQASWAVSAPEPARMVGSYGNLHSQAENAGILVHSHLLVGDCTTKSEQRLLYSYLQISAHLQWISAPVAACPWM